MTGGTARGTHDLVHGLRVGLVLNFGPRPTFRRLLL